MHAIGMAVMGLLVQAQPGAAGPGGAAPAAGDAAGAGAAHVNSVFDLAVKGGPIMIPIALCSIVALAIVVERVLASQRRKVVPREFLAGLKAVAGDRKRAIEYCKANGSPIANVLTAFFRSQGEPAALREKHMEEAGQREVAKLKVRMRIMGALPQCSTMLGLLGTVFGMIKTFQSIAASGQALGRTELLAAGIYEAWTATAAGLLVAIPCLVGYHMLQTRLDRVVAELDKAVQDWVEEHGAGAAPVVVSAPAPVAAVEARPAAAVVQAEPVVVHTNSTVHAPAGAPAGAA